MTRRFLPVSYVCFLGDAHVSSFHERLFPQRKQETKQGNHSVRAALMCFLMSIQRGTMFPIRDLVVSWVFPPRVSWKPSKWSEGVTDMTPAYWGEQNRKQVSILFPTQDTHEPRSGSGVRSLCFLFCGWKQTGLKIGNNSLSCFLGVA